MSASYARVFALKKDNVGGNVIMSTIFTYKKSNLWVSEEEDCGVIVRLKSVVCDELMVGRYTEVPSWSHMSYPHWSAVAHESSIPFYSDMLNSPQRASLWAYTTSLIHHRPVSKRNINAEGVKGFSGITLSSTLLLRRDDNVMPPSVRSVRALQLMVIKLIVELIKLIKLSSNVIDLGL